MQQAMRIDATKVGRRLRRLRQARELTQRELAVDGVSYAYISRIESGSRVPSVQALIAIACVLDTTAQFLVYGRRRPAHCPFCGQAQPIHGELDGEEAAELELDADGG